VLIHHGSSGKGSDACCCTDGYPQRLSSLDEICSQPQYGYTTKGSSSGKLKLLRATDITSGNICWENVPFCLDNPADEDKYLLNDGEVVIFRAGSVGVSYLLKIQRSVFAS
jgi:type I restriction enzyme S subunit